jgi:copper chaperone CopZ
MLPGYVQHAAAVALLGVLLISLLSPLLGGRKLIGGDRPPAARIIVEGMHCTHCTRSVQAALEDCSGVTSAEVDLSSGEATVTGSGFDTGAMLRAVEGLGYGARLSGNHDAAAVK